MLLTSTARALQHASRRCPREILRKIEGRTDDERLGSLMRVLDFKPIQDDLVEGARLPFSWNRNTWIVMASFMTSHGLARLRGVIDQRYPPPPPEPIDIPPAEDYRQWGAW